MTDPAVVGMDILDIIRLSDATLAAYMRGLCKQLIRAGYDVWPTGEAKLAGAAPATHDPDVPSTQESLELPAAALLAFRQQQGWTQAQMGAALGVSGQAVSDLERGKSRLAGAMEARVRALLQATASEAMKRMRSEEAGDGKE